MGCFLVLLSTVKYHKIWFFTVCAHIYKISASDIADQIGGLTAIGVGQGCGAGYLLEILNKWVEKNIRHSEP